MVVLILQTAIAIAVPPSAPAAVWTGSWSALPQLEFPRGSSATTQISDYVRDEVRAGRCGAAVATPFGQALSVELAVQLSTNGRVRRIIPRAIGCATVEQYATGLTSRMARTMLAAPGARTWFRTTIDFAW